MNELWEQRRELTNKVTIAFLFHGQSEQYEEARERLALFYDRVGAITIRAYDE